MSVKKITEVIKQSFLPPYRKNDAPIVIGTLLTLFLLVFTVSVLRTDTNTHGHAATANSVEPESGTVTGNVAIVSDATASGGQYVKFGAPSGPVVYVKDYGTDNAAVQKAANAAAGGTLVFPSNTTYVIATTVTLPSVITVQGNGSTLQTAPNTTTTSTSDGMVDVSNATSVDISGLTFDGNIQNQGGVWSEWRHALRVFDSSNVKIHNNTFINLIGDGIYLGTNYSTPPLPCISSSEIYSNQFTGANQNRNGISIICAKDTKVHDNTFTAMGRPDMPGSIDLEPNSSSQFLQNIQVYSNTINSGTNPATYAQYGILYWGTHNPQASNITISKNTINGPQIKGAGIIFGGATKTSTDPATIATGLTADSNNIQNITAGGTSSNGIELDYGVTATVTNNTINNTGSGINNWYACLIQSGNTITNISNHTIVQTGSTCSAPTPTP